MKMRMRPRYYCDFCGKASGSAWAMKRHEAACTLNPARVCRMCALLELGSSHLDAGKAAFLAPALTSDWPARMAALRTATENCPCCILAVLRQTGVATPAKADEDGPGGYPEGSCWASPLTSSHCLLGFDFKAEMKEALKMHDDAVAGYPIRDSW